MVQKAKLSAVRYGRWAELACRWVLILSGWRILEQSYKSKRGTGAGEIDLIALRGNVLAFIEVKARHNLESGLNAVSPDQQDRIVRGAEAYLGRHVHLSHHNSRFDVMIVRPWRWPQHIADAWRP